MRKLVYECKKDGSVVKTVSMAEAVELKAGGWNVSEILEDIPEKTHCAPLQWARRIKI